MTAYIIKRLLLMIPTTFAISLVMFVVMNVAPGRPGAQLPGQRGESDATEADRRQAYRIFKSQFYLDKPILFNTRFGTTASEVRRLLVIIANKNGDYRAGQVIRATETLEDLGSYSVPALVALLDDREEEIRDLAVRALVMNAPRRVLSAAELRSKGPKARALNRGISRENRYLRSLIYSSQDSAEKKERVRKAWKDWFEKNRKRFRYTTLDKIRIFFLDTRFAHWWGNLLRLDLGISHVDKRPVLRKITERLKYSMTLSLLSIFLAYLISVPLGIFSAVKRNSLPDRILTVVLFMLYSLPSFFVGTLLLFYLSEGGGHLSLFPTGGFQSPGWQRLTTLEQIKDCLWHITLPLACLTYGSLAVLSRYARSGLLEVLGADYIRTARAKGLPEWIVILKHALRNGVIPLLTLLASLLPAVLGGSVIIEFIFNIPGMGLLMVDSIFQRDYNTVMGIGLLSAVLVQLGILLSDVSYALVDPRITFEQKEAR